MNKTVKTSNAVYTYESGCTLTPYVNENCEIWLACEGNGNGDDIMLEDLDGMTDSEAWAKYALIDLNAMMDDADEIEKAGDSDSAEWLRSWCRRMSDVQTGTPVDEEEATNVISELTANGMAEKVDTNEPVCRVWSSSNGECVYRIGREYALLTAGVPSVFDSADGAVSQII